MNDNKIPENHEGKPINIADVSGSFFFDKPQERKIEGEIEFSRNGEKYKSGLVYSIPCERCTGCPVYRIDKFVSPTAYYCQAGFMFGAFNRAIKEDTIPQNCRVAEVSNSKNCH